LPKDNESFPFLKSDGPTERPLGQSFTPDQMVRCPECLRANAPTRTSCLYCGNPLPATDAVHLQKPVLRPLEKWEQGYNTILLPQPANNSFSEGPSPLAEAADVLKLTATDLSKIFSFNLPLPLARAATVADSELVAHRLSRLGLQTMTVPDVRLGADADAPIKVRAIGVDDDGFFAYQTPELAGVKVRWDDVRLVVVGRLIARRIEVKEESKRKSENRILESSEFFSDEAVLDLYAANRDTPYRIAANSFDFSCLDEQKSLLARENFVVLLDWFKRFAVAAEFDHSYLKVQKALELVWPSEQANESRGWRRDGPGRLSVDRVTQFSNEMQFLRYSRLRNLLLRQKEENA
jgi:hypothetical protein